MRKEIFHHTSLVRDEAIREKEPKIIDLSRFLGVHGIPVYIPDFLLGIQAGTCAEVMKCNI